MRKVVVSNTGDRKELLAALYGKFRLMITRLLELIPNIRLVNEYKLVILVHSHQLFKYS